MINRTPESFQESFHDGFDNLHKALLSNLMAVHCEAAARTTLWQFPKNTRLCHSIDMVGHNSPWGQGPCLKLAAIHLARRCLQSQNFAPSTRSIQPLIRDLSSFFGPPRHSFKRLSARRYIPVTSHKDVNCVFGGGAGLHLLDQFCAWDFAVIDHGD